MCVFSHTGGLFLHLTLQLPEPPFKWLCHGGSEELGIFKVCKDPLRSSFIEINALLILSLSIILEPIKTQNWGTWLAHSVGCVTVDLRVVGSSATLGIAVI